METFSLGITGAGGAFGRGAEVEAWPCDWALGWLESAGFPGGTGFPGAIAGFPDGVEAVKRLMVSLAVSVEAEMFRDACFGSGCSSFHSDPSDHCPKDPSKPNLFRTYASLQTV
eukprot:1195633-Prorocentrum_minimum.AAC.5